jgi:sugar phosphate isomerase/epimerase
MPIAIQEDMLPGRTLLHKFENAQALDIAGIEFWAEGLAPRVPEIAHAVAQTGVKAAAVNFGRAGSLLHPQPAERQRALTDLRLAMANSIDIGARQVVFVPHYGAPLLPDLHPYKTAVQLEAEMLVAYLKQIFTDLAYAMGVMLYLEPVNRYETHFVNRLDQMASIRKKIKDHEHVRLAASLFHMALEERDPLHALRDHAAGIGYIHIADSNRGLPGQGKTDFAAVAAVLKDIAYDGWLTLECGEPGSNAPNARVLMADLPDALEMLRRAGIP